MLNLAGAQKAKKIMSLADRNLPTPLHTLPGLARQLGVEAIYVKDESRRLGLGSFKALGGAYAVVTLTLEETSRALTRSISVVDLHASDVRRITANMTFCCATDGNHGRSVAQGARRVGAKAVVFVHEGVSDERIHAIASLGASVVRVPGSYDDSVAEASRVAKDRGWTIVSDTSWPGYEHVPILVMQGYTIMVQEILAALPKPPTHLFVQAGVGGLAASVAAHLALMLGTRRPFFIVVEPERAACLYESAGAGKLQKIKHREPTIMSMLECYEPSLVAWRILSRAADAFMTVSDNDAVEAMNRFAKPSQADTAIVAGESGGAGLAGLLTLSRDQEARAATGLGLNSRVLVINTEGATDPGIYRSLVGIEPDVLSSLPNECGISRENREK